MKLLALFAAVLLTVNASTDQEQWVAFKQTHGKTYKSLLEERTRFGIFQKNLQEIEEHNAKYANGKKTYYMAVTRFSDLTQEEFKNMLGLQNKDRPILNATMHQFPKNLEVPDSINWVEKGAVLHVKDQGQCGSCWAFSSTGSLEGQNIILNNVRTPLSEQQLLDCSKSYGNGNCITGGFMTTAFRYITDHGIESESSYPYEAIQHTCSHTSAKTILKIKGYKEIEKNENELKSAVGTIGPISVALNSAYLKNYGGGILSNLLYCPAGTDHAVLVVGYGTFRGMKYWLVKNSWGSSWGENGYFRIERDAGNLCGIANLSSYPLLK